MSERLLDRPDRVVECVLEDWYLDFVCEQLNDPEPTLYREELRGLVRRWRESGPNLARLLSSDPALALDFSESFTCFLVPSEGARSQVELAMKPCGHIKNRVKRNHVFALGTFAALTVHPDCRMLEGPCAYGPCGKFFINRRRSTSAYCSRRCNQLANATKYTKQRHERDRKQKLAQIEAAITAWRTAHTKDDWKASVCKQIPEVKRQFLTRAVNKGLIVPPTKR